MTREGKAIAVVFQHHGWMPEAFQAIRKAVEEAKEKDISMIFIAELKERIYPDGRYYARSMTEKWMAFAAESAQSMLWELLNVMFGDWNYDTMAGDGWIESRHYDDLLAFLDDCEREVTE